MDLSVVVPTLNGRESLPGTLSAIAEHAPSAELLVVNGPSSDGTSGYVADHDAVDRLIELPDRNPAMARNVGIAKSTGDVLAIVGQDSRIEAGWTEAVLGAIGAGEEVVTGPVHRRIGGDVTTEPLETAAFGKRTVRFFDPGNVAFDRRTIEYLDGFDEHPGVGGSRELAHRLAGSGRRVHWSPGATVLRIKYEERHAAFASFPGEQTSYAALGYRLAKNYGLDFGVGRQLLGDGLVEIGRTGRALLTFEERPGAVFGRGWAAMSGLTRGLFDGLKARRRIASGR